MPHHLKPILLILLLGFVGQCAAQYTVTHLGKPFNTPGSETGAVRVGDTILSYSSLPPSGSNSGAFGFDNAVMQLYQARISRDGKVARPKPNRWGLNSKKDHTGNLAVDPLSHDLYFTRGNIETLRCDIWFARKRKRGWDKPQRLAGAVNSKQYTSTHPTVSRLADSTVLLYFVSDRPGGYGGMDIWYTMVRNGTAGEPVNLGPQVNSGDDEYTPFYDQRNGILYFSSDRAGGKGGFDIYCAVGSRNTWQKAEPVCGCLNSEQNDLYFTVTDYEPSSGFPISGYLASNRADSYFLNDSMCCNDIYEWKTESEKWKDEEEKPDTLDLDTLSSFNSHLSTHFMFPLVLYFHNDEPDPHSRDSVTATNYADCQRRFASLRNEYMARQTTEEDSALMQLFFDTCVVGNFERVQQLFDCIKAALDDDKRVVLTVSGYASPLFTNDYNLLLSARRIGSFINMVHAKRNLGDALDDGRLRIVQQPMGVDNHSSLIIHHSSSNDPVYALSAALSRRIEILSCEIF